MVCRLLTWDNLHRIRCGDYNVFQKNFYGVIPDGRPTRFKLAEQWLKNGCNAYEAKRPLSTPFFFRIALKSVVPGQ